MFNNEELELYFEGGNWFRQELRVQVGDLLMAERLRQGLTLEDVSKLIKIPAKLIEKQEQHRKRINFCILGALLKIYKKQLKITLIDME
ncbi:MAG: hypothetical protein NC218_04195 [Acetobacter sp.]|nr:hypothetical protein [Acetobacter sp.]